MNTTTQSAAVDAHEPHRVAAVFGEDAIREGVADYYDCQPLGLQAQYRILETRRPADGLVLGYLSVDFSFSDRPTLTVYLSVLRTHTKDGWYISHYQVSRLDESLT